jgi:prepilin-type N-terminal cleavage/methylation domain-containing protein
MKIISKQQKGFTLIEMLVSISIIVMISGIFLANFRGSSRKSELSFAAQQMASDIRLTENYSLGLVKYGDVLPTGGWGFYLDQNANQYKIFADVSGDKIYNDGEADTSKSARIITLPKNIVVNSIKYGTSLDNIDTKLNMSFLPPDPLVYIAGQKYYQAEIILKDTRDGSTKTISANFFGLVEVK